MQSISELEELHGEDEEKSHDGMSHMSSETEDDYLLAAHSGGVTPGLGVTTRKNKVEKSRKRKMGQAQVWMSFGTFNRFRNHEPSVRSENRRRLNVVFGFLLVLCLLLLLFIGGLVYYQRVIIPARKAKALEKAIRAHAEAAKARVEMCRGIDWQTACDKLSGAGARRRNLQTSTPSLTTYGEFEEKILDSDDPTVTYDQFCLRVYRLEMFGNVTFPYHSSQLLRSGGNQSMALFIQHGAMRNAEDYFCSFKELMLKQNYRDFNDILIIAPDFNYEHDELVVSGAPIRLQQKWENHNTARLAPTYQQSYRFCSHNIFFASFLYLLSIRATHSGTQPSRGAIGALGPSPIPIAAEKRGRLSRALMFWITW